MKLTRTTAAAFVGAAAILLASTPGQAAMGSWTITGPGGFSGFTSSRIAFGAAHCDPNSPAVQRTQGVDGVAINVANYHNRSLQFSWVSGAPANTGALSGSFLKADCTTSNGTTALPASARPGGWNVFVPSDASWFLVETNGAVLVTLQLNSVA
jgi:hypothetical protein